MKNNCLIIVKNLYLFCTVGKLESLFTDLVSDNVWSTVWRRQVLPWSHTSECRRWSFASWSRCRNSQSTGSTVERSTCQTRNGTLLTSVVEFETSSWFLHSSWNILFGYGLTVEVQLLRAVIAPSRELNSIGTKMILFSRQIAHNT